jgi:alpha-tubulin suppressor-like RCC1 family protein
MAGAEHTCALSTQGTLYCWGDHDYGELGIIEGLDYCGRQGSRQWPCMKAPAEVLGLGKVLVVDVGFHTTYAQLEDGRTVGWGGDLGPKPFELEGWPTFVAPGVGLNQSCGIADDGEPYCWGSLPIAPTRRLGVEEPRRVGEMVGDGIDQADRQRWTFDQLEAAFDHACGLTAGGETYCWGSNEHGQLGVPKSVAGIFAPRPVSSEPVRVSGDELFTSISAMCMHTCGLTAEGDAFCWGNNALGQLGDGTTKNRSRPTAVNWGGAEAATAPENALLGECPSTTGR